MKKEKDNNIKFSLRIDKDIYKYITKYAYEDDRSINKTILVILREYIVKREKGSK